LKRAFTQQIGSVVPSCAADNEGVSSLASTDNSQPLYPELTRRVRNSATTIGLAIAMAASGMLLSQKEQKVMAAEEFGITNPTEALSNLEKSPTPNSSFVSNIPGSSEASNSSPKPMGNQKLRSADSPSVKEVELPTAVVQQPTPVPIQPTSSNSISSPVVSSVREPKLVSKLGNSELTDDPIGVIPQRSGNSEVLATSNSKYQVKSGDTLDNTAKNDDTSVPQLDVEEPLQTNQGSIVPSSKTTLDAEVLESKENLTSQNSSLPSDFIEEPDVNDLKAEIETLQQGTQVQTLVAQTTPESIQINVPEADKESTAQETLEKNSNSDRDRAEVAATTPVEIPVPEPENAQNSISSSESPLLIQPSSDGSKKIPTQANSPTPLPIRRPDNLPLETGAIEIPVPAPASNFIPNQHKESNLATAPLNTDNYNSDIPATPTNPQLKDQFLNPSTNVSYAWPVGGVVTSGFGKRWGRLHAGIDLAAAIGTPVQASAPGIVLRSGWVGGYGKLVEIKHPNGSVTRYGHNSQLMVQAGQEIQQGDVIAMSGNTGRSTGPHVHFEIRPDGKQAVNPITFLPRRA
jgi:murein DD-endopeptidase MepM/ murein hydrolase activator NlpD